MKITELTNLFIGHMEDEDFTVLICALDEQEAMDIAREYANDSGFNSDPDNITIEDFADTKTHFDCDYVLTYSG